MASGPTSGVALASGEHGPFEGSEHDSIVFGEYRRTGTWSPDLVALIAERLFAGAGGTLIDVGANIGLVAIPVLERSTASCVAIEPEPRNHQLLCRNLERHGLQPRVQTHALALDAHNGTVALALCADNSGDHRLVHAQAPEGWPCIGVRAARLDDLLEGRTLARPIVMKLDCQGAEARVLRGAARTLERVDYLVVEYWPAGLLRMGDSAQALQELLLAFPHAVLLGYQSLEGRLRATAMLFAQLAWIPTDGSDEGFFDLLLSRREELAAPVKNARQPR